MCLKGWVTQLPANKIIDAVFRCLNCRLNCTILNDYCNQEHAIITL